MTRKSKKQFQIRKSQVKTKKVPLDLDLLIAIQSCAKKYNNCDKK